MDVGGFLLRFRSGLRNQIDVEPKQMPRVCIRQWQRVVVVSDDLYQLMAQNLPLKKSIRINLYCYSSNSDAILGGEGVG